MFFVIASEAKQSSFVAQRKNGLLRFARNDDHYARSFWFQVSL